MTYNAEKVVLFFDGHCLFCSGFVRFLFWVDRKKRLFFSNLSSQAARSLLSENELSSDALVFLDESGTYMAEQALHRLANYLGWPFSWLSHFLSLVPKSLQAKAYRWFANNRYQILKKRETCFLPPESWKKRFLD